MNNYTKFESNGNQQWYKNGLLHRDNDLPAVIYKCGTSYWYKDGEIHRDSGLPAVIFGIGNVSKQWYEHGKLIKNEMIEGYIETEEE